MTAGPAIRSRTAPPAARATRSSRACRTTGRGRVCGGSSCGAACPGGVSLPRGPTVPCPNPSRADAAGRGRSCGAATAASRPAGPMPWPRRSGPSATGRSWRSRGSAGSSSSSAPIGPGRSPSSARGRDGRPNDERWDFLSTRRRSPSPVPGRVRGRYPNRDDLPSRRFGTVRPGHAAIFLSMTVACKGLEIDAFAYLRDILNRVSTHPYVRIDERLPGAQEGSPYLRTPGRPDRRGSFAVRSDRTTQERALHTISRVRRCPVLGRPRVRCGNPKP